MSFLASSFQGIALLTVALALIGAGASVYSFRDAYLDLDTVRSQGITNGRLLIARINYRAAAIRVAVFLLLSCNAYAAFMVTQSAPEVVNPGIIFIRLVRLGVVLLLSYDSHMTVKQRRDIIQLYEARMREARGEEARPESLI